MAKIAIFASGNGTNAENIFNYYKNKNIFMVFTNNSRAGVIQRAENRNVPCFVFSKIELENGEVLKNILDFEPDLIILAGFLLKFPSDIIQNFQKKIINIHPSLLPKFGGKGMYGMNVHQAVLENREKETGITVHFVNEDYDKGSIIFQKNISIEECATAEDIAAKVHLLEQEYFPKVIESVLSGN